MIFGETYTKDDPTWQWLMNVQETGSKMVGVAGPTNFLPFLRFLPKFKEPLDYLVKGKDRTHQIYRDIIDRQAGMLGDKVRLNECENLTQMFLLERKNVENSKAEEFFSDKQLYHLLADTFGAGIDTTIATLR